MEQRARVLIDCPDTKGLVYKVSKVFFELNLNIDSNQEFVEPEHRHFFMRSVVRGDFEPNQLEHSLKKELDSSVNIKVVPPAKKNIIILATKESHALGDILIRHQAGELDANIIAVIANRENLKELVEQFNIPFYHISADNLSREEHEDLMLEKLSEFKFDYMILAKYMRILTPKFVSKYKGKIINIHHSFLPAFIGANPYKQAYERGVKIIGATAHYVTDDLDEGPIIAQDVISVNHRFNWRDMQKAGRDVEKIVLSRALKLVLEDRVFVHGNKTVVF